MPVDVISATHLRCGDKTGMQKVECLEVHNHAVVQALDHPFLHFGIVGNNSTLYMCRII